jgi:hypothetical protein
MAAVPAGVEFAKAPSVNLEPYEVLAQTLATNIAVGGNSEIGVNVGDEGEDAILYYRGHFDPQNINTVARERTVRDHVAAFANMISTESFPAYTSATWCHEVDIVTALLRGKLAAHEARVAAKELAEMKAHIEGKQA